MSETKFQEENVSVNDVQVEKKQPNLIKIFDVYNN